jgi:hypothetical protein
MKCKNVLDPLSRIDYRVAPGGRHCPAVGLPTLRAYLPFPLGGLRETYPPGRLVAEQTTRARRHAG